MIQIIIRIVMLVEWLISSNSISNNHNSYHNNLLRPIQEAIFPKFKEILIHLNSKAIIRMITTTSKADHTKILSSIINNSKITISRSSINNNIQQG